MLVVLAFVAGLAASVALWRAMAPILGLDLFGRENYRGRALPTSAGLVAVVAVLAVEASVTVVDALGADVDPETLGPRRLVVLAVAGFGLLGLLDDLGGTGQSGGFRGHLRSLVRGALTTGGLKLFGGAALSVVVVAAGTTGRSSGRLIADAALVALSANLANLLDRAPGRVLKGGGAVFVVLAVATGAGPELAGVAIAVGAALGLLLPDLRERCMLGDAGANPLGAVLGVGVVVACSPGVRLAVLGAVAALNLLSEAVSFSKVIDRTPPLRFVDHLGRLP